MKFCRYCHPWSLGLSPTAAVSAVVLVLCLLLGGCGLQKPQAAPPAALAPPFPGPYHAPPAPAGTPAVAEARAQLSTGPHSAKAYYRLGLAYYKRRQYPQAILALERSRRLAPRQPAPCWWLGDAYTASGQPARALPVLEQLVRLPLHPPQTRSDAFVMLGNCEWELSRGPDAARAWRESLRYDPRQPVALLNLGSWAAQQHQPGKARSYFEGAARFAQTPGVRAKAHVGLGELAEEGDDPTTAKREYRLALASDDKNAGAADGLKRLAGR